MIFKTLTFTITLSLAIPTVLCQDDLTCKTVEVLEGTQGKIFCLPRNGIPFRTQWMRNFQPIVNNSEFRIENDGLVILNVQRSHDGPYRVKWTDPDYGSESIKDATVKVIAPATFLTSRSTVDTTVGDNVTLQMTVDGLPRPTCRWYDKYGNSLKPAENIAISGCSLQLYFVQDADAGLFTCIATNKVNTATGSVTLTIQGKIAAGTPPHPLVSVELASVTPKSLTIHVEGPSTGEPVTSMHCIYGVLSSTKLPNEGSVEWLLDPGRNKYTLDNLREGFIYRLHCASISVEKLRSEWSPNLDVKLTPPAPELWVQVLSTENLRLSWDVPSDNVLYENNQIVEYQLSYKTVSRIGSQWIDDTFSRPVLVTSQSRRWDIFQPGTRFYAAKVRARNVAGWSEWSQEITAGGMSS